MVNKSDEKYIKENSPEIRKELADALRDMRSENKSLPEEEKMTKKEMIDTANQIKEEVYSLVIGMTKDTVIQVADTLNSEIDMSRVEELTDEQLTNVRDEVTQLTHDIIESSRESIVGALDVHLNEIAEGKFLPEESSFKIAQSDTQPNIDQSKFLPETSSFPIAQPTPQPDPAAQPTPQPAQDEDDGWWAKQQKKLKRLGKAAVRSTPVIGTLMTAYEDEVAREKQIKEGKNAPSSTEGKLFGSSSVLDILKKIEANTRDLGSGDGTGKPGEKGEPGESKPYGFFNTARDEIKNAMGKTAYGRLTYAAGESLAYKGKSYLKKMKENQSKYNVDSNDKLADKLDPDKDGTYNNTTNNTTNANSNSNSTTTNNTTNANSKSNVSANATSNSNTFKSLAQTIIPTSAPKTNDQINKALTNITNNNQSKATAAKNYSLNAIASTMNLKQQTNNSTQSPQNVTINAKTVTVKGEKEKSIIDTFKEVFMPGGGDKESDSSGGLPDISLGDGDGKKGKAKAGKPGGGKLSKLGNMAKSVGSRALGALGPAAAVAGAGMAGWEIGSAINEKFLTNEDGSNKISNWMSKVTGLDDKLDKGTEPTYVKPKAATAAAPDIKMAGVAEGVKKADEIKQQINDTLKAAAPAPAAPSNSNTTNISASTTAMSVRNHPRNTESTFIRYMDNRWVM